MPVVLGSEIERGEVLVITAPARIHCALLNTSGLFGRVDGGIGFAVDEPNWRIEVGLNISGGKRLPEEIASAVRLAASKVHLIGADPELEPVVICGPRRVEEVEFLRNQEWNCQTIFLYADDHTRYDRFRVSDEGCNSSLSYRDFVSKDLRGIWLGARKDGEPARRSICSEPRLL